MEKGPLESMADGWAQHQHHFRTLDPVSQNLVRAGNGFALMIMMVISPFVLFGMRGVGHYVRMLISDPSHAWPYALGYVGLFAFGLIRFLVGSSRVAGARDALQISRAVFWFALFSTATVYLWVTWPWLNITTSNWGYAGLLLLAGMALWGALSFGVQITLLLWPRNYAYQMVDGHIAQQEFSWDNAAGIRRRRWWQFWKRR